MKYWKISAAVRIRKVLNIAVFIPPNIAKYQSTFPDNSYYYNPD